MAEDDPKVPRRLDRFKADMDQAAAPLKNYSNSRVLEVEVRTTLKKRDERICKISDPVLRESLRKFDPR